LEQMIPNDQIIGFKQMLMERLSPLYSGVLLDPEYGLPAYQKSFQPAAKEKPYLLCIEQTGYEDVSRERITHLEYSVSRLKQLELGRQLLNYVNLLPTPLLLIGIIPSLIIDCLIWRF
jgi:tagatose-1,6-bisphosphate aldolase